MSVAQAWFTRVTFTLRNKYGYFACSGAGLLVSGVGAMADRHSVHQPLDPFAVDVATFRSQRLRDFATSVERPFEMNLVDDPHQPQLSGARRHGLVVKPRAADSQHFTLSAN